MTPHKQLLDHDPERGLYGDCYRTAYACLLDLHPSDVPHFCDGGVSDAEAGEMLASFLAQHGLTTVHIAYPGDVGLDGVLTTMKHVNPGIYHILGGKSRTGCDHVVICCDGEIVHDPSPRNSGIIGAQVDGLYWVIFLAPLAIKRGAA